MTPPRARAASLLVSVGVHALVGVALLRPAPERPPAGVAEPDRVSVEVLDGEGEDVIDVAGDEVASASPAQPAVAPTPPAPRVTQVERVAPRSAPVVVEPAPEPAPEVEPEIAPVAETPPMEPQLVPTSPEAPAPAAEVPPEPTPDEAALAVLESLGVPSDPALPAQIVAEEPAPAAPRGRTAGRSSLDPTPGGPIGEASGDDHEATALELWRIRVQTQLMRQFHPLVAGIADDTLVCRVRIDLDPITGQVLDAAVIEPSGVAEWDEAALRAVRAAGTLPAPPAGAQDRLEGGVDIRFVPP